MSDEKLQNSTSEALRALGRDDLADELENPTPTPELEPVESEGEQFLREIREAQNKGRVSIPGLLDA